MKVRITRTDIKSESREYNIKGKDLAIVALAALERLRAEELHAIHVYATSKTTATINAYPATYNVEEIR